MGQALQALADCRPCVQAVGQALQAVAGPREWSVTEVGGARRGRPGHDVDLLVSPKGGGAAGGVVHALLDYLVSQGECLTGGEMQRVGKLAGTSWLCHKSGRPTAVRCSSCWLLPVLGHAQQAGGE